MVTPGGSTTTGTGSSKTISGLATGTYTYIVTNAEGNTSAASANVVINTQPATPTAPTAGTITQPTCSLATGSVVLNGLPSTGSWTLIRTPGGTTTNGTGISSTITGLSAGTYTYTVTNSAGCISASSVNIIINAQPSTPSAPIIGLIHPTCPVPSGSVVLSGLPTTSWTLTVTPGGTSIPGTGISSTITGLSTGTYTFTVTNATGCVSASSADVVINAVKYVVIPRIKVKWGDVLICSNLGDSLKGFLWYNGTTAIAGANSQIYVTHKNTGIYKVETIDINGCKNTSKTISIPISGTKSLSIYPNPASVSFSLKISDEFEGSALITILTSTGTKVREFRLENLNNELLAEIPVSDLNEGIYIVKVLLNQNLYYAKIVVKK